MSETPTNKASNRATGKLRIQMIAGFAVLIPVMIIVIISVFYIRMSNAMKEQTADMIHNINSQIKFSSDNYLSVVASNVGMVASDEVISGYSPTDKKDDTTEDMIEEKLASYPLYAEYIDFGVVYSDGSSLGKISDELIEAGGGRLYAMMDRALSRSDGWSTDLMSDRSRMAYVCRVNDTALAIASLPSTELSDRLTNSLFLDGMNVYLADKSLVVISTTDPEIIPGSYLKTTISRLVDRVNATAQIGDNYVVATQRLDNNWFLITAVPSDDILTPLKSSIKYVILISVILSVLGIAYVLFMTKRVSESVSQTVDRLDVKAQTDLLTGLVNKKSFENIVNMTLNNPEEHTCYAMIFMDIDNFKGVNDRCGHDVGDMVLKSFSHTIDTVFRETDVKGRLGGDEFCVLMKMTEENRDMVMAHITEVCRRFTEALHRKANSARQSLPAVTSSMGAALWEGFPEGFEELYHKADTALYASKNRGKDTWSIYGQNDVTDPTGKE